MNKLFSKIATLSVGLLMAIGVGVGIGANKGASEARADEATLKCVVTTTGNMTGGNDAASVNLSSTDWEVVADKGGNGNYPGLNKDGTIRMYGSDKNANIITVTNSNGDTISSITVSYSSGYDGGIIKVGGNTISGNDNTYAINASSFSVHHHKSSTTQVRITSIVITYSSGGVTPPTPVTQYTITYDANVGDSGDTVTNMPSNGTVDEGEDYTLDSTTIPVRAGYIFNGWAESSDSTTAITVLEEVGGDSAVYAIWTADSRTKVTFDATKDTGTSPLSKNGVTFTCGSGVLNNGSEYRLYKSSVTTFSVTSGKIVEIFFKGVSGNPASGFGTQTGWETSGYDGRWSGKETTVSFTASGAQVRATQIDVYILPPETKQATGMTISPASASVYAGETVTFTPTLTGGEGSYEKTISWTTDDASIVAKPANSVDGASVTVTTLATGTVTLTGTVVSPGSASQSITITVNAPKTLSSISVDTAPTKTTYSEDEYFDPTGLVIRRTFSDATSDTYAYANHTSEFTFSPSLSTALKVKDKSVSITYGGKSTSQAITVNEVTRYELVTDASGLVSGCNYVIGNASKTHFISTTQASNNRAAHVLTGTVNNDVVNFETGMEIINLGGSDGVWTLNATAGTGDALGYLYAAGANSNNYLRTKSDSTTWTISIDSNGYATLTSAAATRGLMRYNPNNNSPMFACYAAGSTTGETTTIWKEISTAESVSITKDTVSAMKTDSADTSVSIICTNFTPTGIGQVTYSTAGVASVAGAASDGNINLTVTFNDVGTTTATIPVLGGEDEHQVQLTITVDQKPDSLTLVNSYIHDGEIDVKLGSSRQISFTALDTDGESYQVSYKGTNEGDKSAINATTSDESIVSLSGSTNLVLNGAALGQATITCTIATTSSWNNPITRTLIVHVINDYNETVNTIAFNENLAANQGDTIDTEEIFSSKVANTHFGSTAAIDDSELLFSYSDRSSAVSLAMFAFDFSGTPTTDDDQGKARKIQTVYVFVTFDEDYAGTSFSITVTQKDDPLTAITLTNTEIVNGEVDLNRGSSLQLTWALTPTNPTDGRDLQFSIDCDPGVDVTVNSTGLINVSSTSGLGTALVDVVAKHNENISTSVLVNVGLEDMDYTARSAISYTKITSASELVSGDYLIVYESSETEAIVMNGGASTIDSASSKITGVEISESVIAGSSSVNGATFHYDATATTIYSSSGKYMGRTSDTNGIDTNESTQYTNTITFDDNGNALITGSGNAVLRYNSSDARFRYYKSTTYSAQKAVSLYLKSGGDSTINVTETLFNAVHNNFGEGLTYEWNPSCENFDDEAWAAACGEITKIANYANYKLNIAVADASGNEIEQFLARYDLVISKVGNSYDYLGRFTTDGINAGIKNVSPLATLNQINDGTIIIVAISMVSLLSLGGYFYLKKEKKTKI